MQWKVAMVFAATPLDPEEFRKMGADFSLSHCNSEEEIIDAAQGSDVVITTLLPITRKVLNSMDRCRLIHNMGMGYEGVDMEAATEYGICVSYGGDYCADEVAEHTMALLLACARKVPLLDRAVKEGKWDSPPRKELRKLFTPMFRMKGQTLGIIGLGNVGRRILPIAKGFGLRVLCHDPYVLPNVFEHLGAESVELPVLLKNADFVSLNCSLTKETKHMLGLEELGKLKPTAYLINTARGPLVDQEALAISLTNGSIAGAALDVLEGECIGPGDPLFGLDNVIFTGHSAFYSEQATAEMRRRAYEQVRQILQGEWPTWLLNSKVKEKYLEKWNL